MAQWPIEFLHRSLRDFLLMPKIQGLLHQSTNGLYDARMFYRSARLVQLIALNRVGTSIGTIGLAKTIRLADYVLSTLSISSFRNEPGSAALAIIAQPAIENLAHLVSISANLQPQELWCMHCVLHSWKREESTFLTLAIDFGLISYIRAHLTARSVHRKKGPPILDYVLRPRFVMRVNRSEICIGNQLHDLCLLETILDVGANPNQTYDCSSAWALFVSHS